MESSALLNPGDSPHRAQPVGVRRLNHIPLYIIGALSCVVLVLVAMVAIEKGKPMPGSPVDHGGGTDVYAQQIAGDRGGYLPALRTPTPAPITPPVATATPAPPPADNTELVARKKAFYDALFATSAVPDQMVDKMTAQREQALSAADAAKAVKADPNNLGGATPGEITEMEHKAALAALPPHPNSLTTSTGPKDRWTLNTRLEKPPTPYILRTGWVIPALLLSAMESELPGTITAQVAQDVYDTPTGKYLLIPQGSRLVGEYANSIEYGQSRIFVAWQRIIFPNGDALDIGAMPGADAQGEAGFHDQVNNHFLRVFGSALLMSAITGGISLSQPNQNNESAPNAGSVLSAALGQQLGAATSALLERNLSIPPSLKIRQAYSFNVVVVKDLAFEGPYVVPNY
jgi:type IV secretory pathway VirB10-like protein